VQIIIRTRAYKFGFKQLHAHLQDAGACFCSFILN